MAVLDKRRRGAFRIGDPVVSESGSTYGRIVSLDAVDLRVREHSPFSGIVVGKRRYWHHDLETERSAVEA